MEPIKVKFCEVHSPVFIAGKNLGVKLDPSRLGGLALFYHREYKELAIQWNGETGYVPSTNIVVYVPGEVKVPAPIVSHPMVAGVSTTAQVETPYGHVHAGPGKGKSK